MANEANLIPFNKRTESEQREYAKKGGQKSGEVRRKKKTMKEAMKMLLNLDMPECDDKENLRQLGISDDDLDIQTAILLQQVKKALMGNLDSAKFVKDALDEKNETGNKESASLADAIQQAYESKAGDK